MHTDETTITSAHKAWDKANPKQRITMLHEAGHTACGHAYQKFADLPMEIKLDLNYVATRKANKEVTPA